MVGDVEWLRCGQKIIFFTGQYRAKITFYGSLSDLSNKNISPRYQSQLFPITHEMDFNEEAALVYLVDQNDFEQLLEIGEIDDLSLIHI